MNLEDIKAQYQKCQPALIYFVIATAMALVGLLLSFTTNTGNLQQNLSSFLSHLCSIFLCSALLLGLCSVFPGISWAFLVLFIISQLSAVFALFGQAFQTTTTSASNLLPQGGYSYGYGSTPSSSKQ